MESAIAVGVGAVAVACYVWHARHLKRKQLEWAAIEAEIIVANNPFRGIKGKLDARRERTWMQRQIERNAGLPPATIAEVAARMLEPKNGPETPATPELAAGQLASSLPPPQGVISGDRRQPSEGGSNPPGPTTFMETEVWKAAIAKGIKAMVQPEGRTRYLVAGSPEMAGAWVANNVAPGPADEYLTGKLLRELPALWRRGDVLALVNDWWTMPNVELARVGYFIEQRWGAVARPDVELWAIEPNQAPFNPSLKPLAGDIGFSRVCVQCGKPSLVHKYKLDFDDPYQSTGIWECLPEQLKPREVAPKIPDLYERVAQGGALPSAQFYSGGQLYSRTVFSKRDLLAAKAQAGAWAEALGRQTPEPEPDPAPVVTRATRAYEDDF